MRFRSETSPLYVNATYSPIRTKSTTMKMRKIITTAHPTDSRPVLGHHGPRSAGWVSAEALVALGVGLAQVQHRELLGAGLGRGQELGPQRCIGQGPGERPAQGLDVAGRREGGGDPVR